MAHHNTDFCIISEPLSRWSAAQSVLAQERPLSKLLSSRPTSLAWLERLNSHPHSSPTLPPRLWIAWRRRNPAGLIVGVPFRGQAAGKPFEGLWGIDLYVPPSERGSGVGRALVTAWRDAAPVALGFGVSTLGLPLFLKLGWREMEVPPRQVRGLTKRGAVFLAAKLRQSSPLVTPRVAPQIGPQLDQEPASVAELDALWSHLALHSACQLERTGSFLHWRFPVNALTELNPDQIMWLCIRESRVLVGYAVIRVLTSAFHKKLMLLDFLCVPVRSSIDTLIASVLALGLELHVDLIEARVTLPSERSCFHHFGFLDSHYHDRFIVYAKDSLVHRSLSNQPWHLTFADSGNP